MTRKRPISQAAFQRGHFHTRVITRKSKMLLMTMSEETDRP